MSIGVLKITPTWGYVMIKDERYEQILQILDDEKYISASALAKRLFVSLPTIRRDLAELQHRNLILRSHGGAKKVGNGLYQIPLDFRKATKQSEKKHLCRAAAKLIKDNDTVFIDASTTLLPLAEEISHMKNVTVVTNGINLALLLNKHNIKTYCTGGEVMDNSIAFAGGYAEEFVSNFNFDIMFYSSYGVSSQGYAVDPFLPENHLRRAVSKHSKKTVLVCDGDKFNLCAPHNIMKIQDLDFLITNTTLPNGIEIAPEKLIIVK